MNEPEIAPPATFLGQLQRGRGAALREIEAGADAEAEVALCVTSDPRWDHQVEHRSTYYTSMILDRGWGLDWAETHLFAPDNDADRFSWRDSLTIDVLNALRCAGNGNATALLRRYIGSGGDWEHALWSLAEHGDPSDLIGLDKVLVARFGDDESLDRVVEDNSPWREWAATQARIHEALQRLRADSRDRQSRRTPDPDVRAMSQTELVTLVRARGHLARDAGRELGRRADTVVFDLAEEMLPTIGAGRAGLYRALREWPNDDVLAWARCHTSFDDPIHHDAIGLLGRRGSYYDGATLTRYVEASIDQGNWCMCTEVEGLGRIGYSRAEQTLVRVWNVTRHSYGRIDVLKALIALRSGTVEELATEGLWDCEAQVREAAIEAVPSTEAARERLRRMAADDPDDEVRAAASTRLAGC